MRAFKTFTSQFLSDRNPDILADLGQVFGFTRPVFLDWSGVVYLTAYAYSVSS